MGEKRKGDPTDESGTEKQSKMELNMARAENQKAAREAEYRKTASEVEYDDTKSVMENLVISKSIRVIWQIYQKMLDMLRGDDSFTEKEVDNIHCKTKLLCKRQKIDNDIVPEEVVELLTPQHTLLIIKNIKEKRENPVKETDDEAFISENADILPPEVARELSRKRRREICKKIRTRRQKKEAAGTRTNSAHT